jgi:uncharacterized protein involved in outer membrane biogenesis
MLIWLKRLGWCALAWTLLCVLGYAALPPLIGWQLPVRLGKALGRPVTLGSVSIKPWSLELTLRDLAVGGLPGVAQPVLHIERLHVNAALSSLLRRAPIIEALQVLNPKLHITRTVQGHYDIDDLVARFQAPPQEVTQTEPAKFALYNLQMQGGHVHFDDQLQSRAHDITALDLTLPALSNLPAAVQTQVEPRLRFKLGDTLFDSGAQAMPFAPNRPGTLHLKIDALNVAPYLNYLDKSLPVRLASATISTQLEVQFSAPEHAPPSVEIKGNLALNDLGLSDVHGHPLASLRHMVVELSQIQPLAHTVSLGALHIDGLKLHLQRDTHGNLNLMQLLGPPEPKNTKHHATPAWQLDLHSLDITDSAVLWSDASTQPAAALQLSKLSLQTKGLHWPLRNAVELKLAAALQTQGKEPHGFGQFKLQGPVTLDSAKLALELNALSVEAFTPYMAQAITPTVQGHLSAHAQLDWSGDPQAPKLQLGVGQAELLGLQWREANGLTSSVKQFKLENMQLDMLQRSVALGQVHIDQPVLMLERNAQGQPNWQRWTTSQTAAEPTKTSSPWHIALKDLTLKGGQLQFTDMGQPQALKASVAELNVSLHNFAWQGERSTPASQIEISTRLGPTRRATTAPLSGKMAFKGQMGLSPLLLSGSLQTERLPLHLAAPYVAANMKLALLRAELGYRGNVALGLTPQGLNANLQGNALLGNVHVAEKVPGNDFDELLTWKSLSLTGIKFDIQPLRRPTLAIGEAALNDFYSRLVITEQGRFNLQDADAATAPPATSSQSAPEKIAATPALPIDLQLGPTTFSKGRIDFTDRFIRPNYSATLTELNGNLGALRSDKAEMAALNVQGKVAGTALLDIKGQLNPFTKPLAMDINAKATDLDLAPLSAYAGKYAGYAIERGKLSMDVGYKISPNGQLDAKNQIILKQLTFGDKIESKDATKLPVRLAVALLKDRHGVIDINLPVKGSLNDPEFSVGGVILKVLVNLLGKAITSPFALLSGGGGGEELNVVEFQPGTNQAKASGSAAIDKVAQALLARPSLKVTITGMFDAEQESGALRLASMEARLQAMYKKSQEPDGEENGDKESSADAELDAKTRETLLRSIYNSAPIPNKPRNALGLTKDISVPEMQVLIQQSATLPPQTMHELAQERGTKVRDALLAKGLPNERVFLAAPKVNISGPAESKLGVQLTLGAQ